MRIVLVQPEMQVAQQLARYFSQRGDEVWKAWELGQAEALIEQVKPTLILMDLHFADGDWFPFLRRVHQANPGATIIMTNKHPDLQREIMAREQGVQVFLRQPFTPHWIEQALKRSEDTRPVRVQRRLVVEPAAGDLAVPEVAAPKVAAPNVTAPEVAVKVAAQKMESGAEPAAAEPSVEDQAAAAAVAEQLAAGEPVAILTGEEPPGSNELECEELQPEKVPVKDKATSRPAALRIPARYAARSKRSTAHASPLKTVRVPVRVKITLPYLLLVLVIALASAYLVSRVMLESVQERFLNQLIKTGVQTSEWMVREENRLLSTLRLVANTQGTADAILENDAEALREIVLPLAVNAGEEAVEILDLAGTSLFSARRQPEDGLQSYQYTRGDAIFREWPLVQKVAAQAVDGAGDKYAGLSRAPWGDVFYVSGPVFDASGDLVGIVLVGKSLRSMAREMHEDSLGEITLYDHTGQPLVSTLFTGETRYPLEESALERVLNNGETGALTRDLTIATIAYTEILAPWEARRVPLGVLGVSLGQAFLLRASQVTQLQIFILVAAGIFLVLLVGIYLANLITRPLLRLVQASGEVARGNLEIKVDASGNDEVAVLSQSFNYMVAGLQEGSVYRDLLGRTVSPEVREQLRQTFNSGNLRLEGQQAVATVLMTDIRGFTPISERADPATVFQWLNEYFAQIVPIISAHGGVVNKFDGDAVLAFFGILPRLLSPKQSASAACQAALEILQAVDTLNKERVRRGAPPLITGVGVNTGVVMAGGLGTSDRLHYTIIGDTVNTAQRIESLTRDLPDCSGVLVSESTYAAMGGARLRYNFQPLGERSVKGKAEPILVYRLLHPEAHDQEPGR